jgi:hypothetical protein
MGKAKKEKVELVKYKLLSNPKETVLVPAQTLKEAKEFIQDIRNNPFEIFSLVDKYKHYLGDRGILTKVPALIDSYTTAKFANYTDTRLDRFLQNMGTAANEDYIVLKICENALYDLLNGHSDKVREKLFGYDMTLRSKVRSLDELCKVNPETPCAY